MLLRFTVHTDSFTAYHNNNNNKLSLRRLIGNIKNTLCVKKLELIKAYMQFLKYKIEL